MEEKKKTKNTFFNFEKEVYDPQTETFKIPNLKEEKEKLNNFIATKSVEIDNTENLDFKVLLTQNFNKKVKSIEKELAEVKKEIKEKHLNALLKELGEFSTDLKTAREGIQDNVVDQLTKAGKQNVFYVAPAYEIRTSPTTDVEKLQYAVQMLNQLGLETKLYCNGKLLAVDGKIDNMKQEDNKRKKGIVKDDDGTYHLG